MSAPDEVAPGARGVVVVLVDDEKTVLDSLCAQLDALFGGRVECETAESAEEGWEVLIDLHAHGAAAVVVVSDWLMPGQRGDAFLMAVRARFPRIGRIMLTGQADRDALERARTAAAAHRILFKPWRPDELRAAITDAAAVAR